MAYRTEGLDLTNRDDRRRVMSWCRKTAHSKLARIHKDEYRALLRLEYAEAGIDVRPRGMTAAERKARRIARLREQIAALESEQ